MLSIISLYMLVVSLFRQYVCSGYQQSEAIQLPCSQVYHTKVCDNIPPGKRQPGDHLEGMGHFISNSKLIRETDCVNI